MIILRSVAIAATLAAGACVSPGGDASATGSLGEGRVRVAAIGTDGGGGGAAFQRGMATWYGPGFHGRRTASGERFNAGAMTAAHRTLPFGTRVRVLNESTGRAVVVRINDRGPFTRGKIIDLAAGPARAIGMSGTSRVALQRLD